MADALKDRLQGLLEGSKFPEGVRWNMQRVHGFVEVGFTAKEKFVSFAVGDHDLEKKEFPQPFGRPSLQFDELMKRRIASSLDTLRAKIGG